MATEDDVRRLALALPETHERPSYGTPGFRVKDRLFARIHQDGGVPASCSGWPGASARRNPYGRPLMSERSLATVAG
jgi:hypothetical protein